MGGVAVQLMLTSQKRLVWPWLLVALLCTAAVLLLERHRREQPSGGDGDAGKPLGELDRALAQLAEAVTEQWQAEQRLRRLQDPSPLPVRWTAADPLLMDHWENITGGSGRRAPGMLAGRLDQVVETFSQVPSRRLVVLGEPGAGKTVFMLQLTLALLSRRQPTDPVPVIFPLASWHPDQPLRAWMVQRLKLDYPLLAAPASSGASRAGELVRAHRVLPVLDGLDELPAGLRARAVTALNRALDQGEPVVVSCRTQEYRAALDTADTVFRGAAVVELRPPTLRQVVDYLRRTSRKTVSSQRGRAQTKWEPVFGYLQDHPDDPVATSLAGVLTNPLMATLARTAYSDTGADPRALLDPRFADPGLLEGHLLDGFVPAVFAVAPMGDTAGRLWPADRAQGWLSFLAVHLTRLHTRDLAWWRLEQAAPWPIRGLAGAVGITLPIGIALFADKAFNDTGLSIGWMVAALAGGGIGLAGGLALAMKAFTREPTAAARRGFRAHLALQLRRVGYGLAVGLPGGLLVAAAAWLAGHATRPVDLAFEPVFVFAVALAGGIGVGLVFPAAGVTRDLTPSTMLLQWRRGLGVLLRRLGYGIAFGLTAGLLTALAFALAAGLGYGAALGARSQLMGELPGGQAGRLPDGTRYVGRWPGRFYAAPANQRSVVLWDGTRYTTAPVRAQRGDGTSFTGDVLAEHRDGSTFVRDPKDGWWISPDGVARSRLKGLDGKLLPQPADDWIVSSTELNRVRFAVLMAHLNDVGFALLITGLIVGVTGGLAGGIYIWLDEPADMARSISPISTLRTDRAAALVRGLTAALLVSFLGVLLYMTLGQLSAREASLAAVIFGIPVGLMTICLTAWGRLAVTRSWLAARGRLPWRVMTFLRDAHHRGALRQAGGVYQFRHVRLQHRLASTAASGGGVGGDRLQPLAATTLQAALPPQNQNPESVSEAPDMERPVIE